LLSVEILFLAKWAIKCASVHSSKVLINQY